MHSKRGNRLLGTARRPSLLGGSMLERARSTTFALLGATAALGLAMVALALNQSWPLVAGSAIPAPPARVGVGKASVVAAATSPRLIGSGGNEEARSGGHVRDVATHSAGDAVSGVGPVDGEGYVVSPSTPVSAGSGDDAKQVPAQQGQQPRQTTETPAAQVAPPATTPAPTSTPTTPVVNETTTSPPTTAETPGEGEGSHGGEPSEEGNEQGDEGGEEGGWHGHSGSHGHHWGH